LKLEWKIPPNANAAFVAALEDVLDVYARPFDPTRPVICFVLTNHARVVESCVQA
jgi:hypothetical protein